MTEREPEKEYFLSFVHLEVLWELDPIIIPGSLNPFESHLKTMMLKNTTGIITITSQGVNEN